MIRVPYGHEFLSIASVDLSRSLQVGEPGFDFLTSKR